MNEPFVRLTDCLARLPGIGRRTAERIAIRLAREPGHNLTLELIERLKDLQERIRLCSRCGGLTDVETDPCRHCTDPRRDGETLCIVGQPGDLEALEASGAFRGRYHILNARLSPMRGEGLPHLQMERLARRLEQEPIREVILALDTDADSDATAAYLKEWLTPRNLRVSRLAFGLPAGSGVAFTDSLTLARALDGRREL
jgi:recombination protein RecR